MRYVTRICLGREANGQGYLTLYSPVPQIFFRTLQLVDSAAGPEGYGFRIFAASSLPAVGEAPPLGSLVWRQERGVTLSPALNAANTLKGSNDTLIVQFGGNFDKRVDAGRFALELRAV